jgi:hypothetical protein
MKLSKKVKLNAGDKIGNLTIRSIQNGIAVVKGDDGEIGWSLIEDLETFSKNKSWKNE